MDEQETAGKKGGLLASTLVVSSMTLLSRVLGLVRDVVLARLLGASAGTLDRKYGPTPYSCLARSDCTIVFSLGKVRMVEAMARLPAPIATSESSPRLSTGCQRGSRRTLRARCVVGGAPARDAPFKVDVIGGAESRFSY